MPIDQSQPSESTEPPCGLVQENAPSGNESCVPGGEDAQAPRNIASVPQSKFRKMLAAVNAFPDSMDEEEPEFPSPPPEKPLKESVREFVEHCRDRKNSIAMMKEFGEWSWTMFFRDTVFFFLFVLTIRGTIWALDFSENHRIRFYSSDEVVDYISTGHESLGKTSDQLTLQSGKNNIPFDLFDAKLIKTVRPIRIYSDEYGGYFMTNKGWSTANTAYSSRRTRKTCRRI